MREGGRAISTYRSIIVNIDIYPLAQHYRYNLLYSVKSDLVQFIGSLGSAGSTSSTGAISSPPAANAVASIAPLAQVRIISVIYFSSSAMDIGTKASKAAFSIENILEQKTRTARSPPVESLHRSQSSRGSSQSPVGPPQPAVAMPKALASTTTPTATSATNIYDLSREAVAAQYALKNLDTSPVLAPTTLRFNPIYPDPASLFYQQVLNLQKNPSLFMPHFQAAAVAAAAAVQPTGYCDQYSPFAMDCEGEFRFQFLQ